MVVFQAIPAKKKNESHGLSSVEQWSQLRAEIFVFWVVDGHVMVRFAGEENPPTCEDCCLEGVHQSL